MKRVHLAFSHEGNNHHYQKPLWEKAIIAMNWVEADLRDADLVIMWGINPEFEQARLLNKPVLMIDFPYWNREKKKLGNEFYKVSLNGQHPTPYIMNEKHNPRRYYQTLGPHLRPWRTSGRYIMIAGMGVKAAQYYGYSLGGWETKIAQVIQRYTNMPIIYRPKPGQKPIVRIHDTTLDSGQFPIEQAMDNCHAVVCHHGNPTVTALARGIPIFMNGAIGAASHLASFDFDSLLKPKFFDNRQQFFNNISHWQWSVKEITSGAVLQSYLDRGLLSESSSPISIAGISNTLT